MKTLSLIQGSPEWHAHRARARNASDAAAMLDCSPYMTRTELLHAMHTGLRAEATPQQQERFARGHAVEAAMRPIAQEIIGEELYPSVGVGSVSGIELSASFDGLTMAEDTNWECKSLNEELRAALPHQGPDENAAAALPKCYRVQMEQQLMVCAGDRVLFSAGEITDDGQITDARHCWYYSDPKLRAEILAGWRQFDEDLAAYVPREAAPRAQAAPVESLPAVAVQVSGSIAVQTNLDLFAGKLRAFVAKIPKAPASDQEFADAEAACKALKNAEDTIKKAGESAIAQVASVEELTRQLKDLGNLARDARLATEKLVTARKKELKEAEVIRGRAAVQQHWDGLNTRLGHPYMPAPSAEVMDFAGAISGLKSLDSVRNAIDTKIASGKIAGNDIADKIEINLRALREHASEHKHLFPDTSTLVLKAAEDCRAVIDSRIAAHREQEEHRLEAERERIRKEEAARLEREQQEREALERRQREEAAAQDQRQREVAAASAAAVAQGTLGGPIGAPVAATPNVVPMRAAQPAAPDEKPTLTLGAICERLGITMTSAFVRQLGVAGLSSPRAGVYLYTESDFQMLGESLKAHITTKQYQAAQKQREAA